MDDGYGPPTDHDDLWLAEKTAQAWPDPWTSVVPAPRRGTPPIPGQISFLVTDEDEGDSDTPQDPRPSERVVAALDGPAETWMVYRMTDDGVEPVDPGLGLGPFDEEEVRPHSWMTSIHDEIRCRDCGVFTNPAFKAQYDEAGCDFDIGPFDEEEE